MNSDPSETPQSSAHDHADPPIDDLNPPTQLNSHPSYRAEVGLFSAAVTMNEHVAEKMARWHERNAQRGPFERKRKIDMSLSQASGIDVLFGDLPAGKQYFGEDYTTIFTSRPGI